MKINILICTYNNGIQRVPNVLMPYHADITYKVSHQIDGDTIFQIPDILSERIDVEVHQTIGRGLSINRNCSLSMADGDICFIADDDVTYNLENVLLAAEILNSDKDTAILCGQIMTLENEPEFKKYPSNSYNIGWKNIGRVSSIEMIFKRSKILDARLQFDSFFGIGGKLCAKGEESVFLSDALKNGLSIAYYPIKIVIHPYESSGNNLIYDENEAKYYGTLFCRIFGVWSYILGLPLSILHRKRYSGRMPWSKFISAYYQGLKSYNRASSK